MQSRAGVPLCFCFHGIVDSGFFCNHLYQVVIIGGWGWN